MADLTTICLIRNEDEDNLLSTSDGTEITVSAIGTSIGTITLSWLPDRSSIWSPTSGEEWALLDLENITGTEGTAGEGGDYQIRLKITDGTYASKILNYVDVGAIPDSNINVGDKVALYNPHEDGTGWIFGNDGNYIIGSSGTGWRKTFVNPGGIFQHSDGRYIMLVTGASDDERAIGAFESNDLITWTVLNNDNAIFTKGGSGWRENGIVSSGTVLKLEDEDKYILYLSGKDSSDEWSIGWVKFNEDFDASSIEYASNELTDRTSGDDHIRPSVIKYCGRYRMIFRKRPKSQGGYTVGDDTIEEIYSSTNSQDSGFDGTTTTIFSGDLSNDGSWRSSHPASMFYLAYKGRLYGLLMAASKWKYSGNFANNEVGLVYWDETQTPAVWTEDDKSPIFINAMYATATLWGSNYLWQNDHMGGRFSIIIKDNCLYLFFSACAGTDTYQIGVMYTKYNVFLELRFNNYVFGGSYDFSVPLVDMPEYPKSEDYRVKKNSYRAYDGELHSYLLYKKMKQSFNFIEVSEDTKGTIENIALEDKDIRLHYDTEIIGTNGMIGTFKWIENNLRMQEVIDGLWNFDFTLEEV